MQQSYLSFAPDLSRGQRIGKADRQENRIICDSIAFLPRYFVLIRNIVQIFLQKTHNIPVLSKHDEQT